MSSVQFDFQCPHCGNPKGQAESWPKTGEDRIFCYRCGYTKSHFLTQEFWELPTNEQTNDKLFDGEKWWKTQEDIPVGFAQVWYLSGGGHNFSLHSKEQIEGFKAAFQIYFIDPDGYFQVGQNILSEYRDGKFYVTQLETMTTTEYSPDDYFRDVVVIAEE